MINRTNDIAHDLLLYVYMMSQWGSDKSINISCSQPILIYCDFVDKLRKLVHTDNYAPQLRRERGLNDDNY